MHKYSITFDDKCYGGRLFAEALVNQGVKYEDDHHHSSTYIHTTHTHIYLPHTHILSYVILFAFFRFVFTLTGGHISPILVGCKEMGIRVIDVR